MLFFVHLAIYHYHFVLLFIVNAITITKCCVQFSADKLIKLDPLQLNVVIKRFSFNIAKHSPGK